MSQKRNLTKTAVLKRLHNLGDRVDTYILAPDNIKQAKYWKGYKDMLLRAYKFIEHIGTKNWDDMKDEH